MKSVELSAWYLYVIEATMVCAFGIFIIATIGGWIWGSCVILAGINCAALAVKSYRQQRGNP